MASLAEWRPQARNPKLSPCQPRGTEDDTVLSVVCRVATRISQAARPESIRDIVELVGEVVPCDSCLLYVLEDSELVLRASKNPHPGVVDRLKLTVGQGVSGWVAGRKELAVIPRGAAFDPRFQLFNELPDGRCEAFLSLPLVGRGKLVGVLNVQCRAPHQFSEQEIGLVSAIGYLVGAEIEIAKLEEQNIELSKKLATRTLVERAKGILQADLRITEQEAYQKLQRQSQQMRRSMKQIAEAVVLSHALRIDGQA
jgi:signal transduction protein with GAF and PtsI domain